MRLRVRRAGKGTALWAAVAATLAAPAPAAEPDAPPQAGAQDGPWGRGRVDLRYQFRSTGEGDASLRDHDQDLQQGIFLEGGVGHTFRAEASGLLHEDIDGRPTLSRFRDMYDTYGSPVVGFLYTAYGEMLDVGPLARVRLGRQYYGEGIGVRFDGGLIETAPLLDALKLTAYGGSPANLYESSRRGDSIVGLAAEVTAISRATLRLDYVHLTDRRDDLIGAAVAPGGTNSIVRDDDLFAAGLTVRLLDDVKLVARASTFEGRSTRLDVQALWQPRWTDFSARVRYLVQLGSYRDLSLSFAPLDETLGPFEPYQEIAGDVRKGLGENLSAMAGVQLRELIHERDEGANNRGFSRVFGRIDLTGWPWEGLSADVLVDFYRRENGEKTVAVSGDLSQAIGPVTLSAGSSYSLYRFDEFFLVERDEVRTFSGSVAWHISKCLTVQASYSFEEDRLDRYHVGRCDVRISF